MCALFLHLFIWWSRCYCTSKPSRVLVITWVPGLQFPVIPTNRSGVVPRNTHSKAPPQWLMQLIYGPTTWGQSGTGKRRQLLWDTRGNSETTVTKQLLSSDSKYTAKELSSSLERSRISTGKKGVHYPGPHVEFFSGSQMSLTLETTLCRSPQVEEPNRKWLSYNQEYFIETSERSQWMSFQEKK